MSRSPRHFLGKKWHPSWIPLSPRITKEKTDDQPRPIFAVAAPAERPIGSFSGYGYPHGTERQRRILSRQREHHHGISRPPPHRDQAVRSRGEINRRCSAAKAHRLLISPMAADAMSTLRRCTHPSIAPHHPVYYGSMHELCKRSLSTPGSRAEQQVSHQDVVMSTGASL